MSDFDSLLKCCRSVADDLSGDTVFIGGIAVYLYAANNGLIDLAEGTHDGDMYVSFSDMSDLRDIEDVTTNKRLSKYQFIRSGFEFDVYVERQSSLIVPYDEVVANSCQYDGVSVASLPHLLALKLEAYKDRKGSSKGDKDVKDIIRIAMIADKIGFDPGLCLKYLDDDHLSLLSDACKSPMAQVIASGNAVVAKNIRAKVVALYDQITNYPPIPSN